MATVINDLSDRSAKQPIAYGRHAVKGVLAKHVVDVSGADKVITIQQELGQASQLFFDAGGSPFYVGGGWDALEKLYYGPQGAGVEITADDYVFHPGGPADAPDAFFPDDTPHPRAAYYSARLPKGIADDNDPGNMFGIFRTLKIANYNEDGQQIDQDGDPIPGGSNPDDFLWYSASPMREIADLYRRSRRNLVNINWPAWCYLRDWHAALINWDDGALTPHQIAVVAQAGGALAPATYWVRVATLKGGDISSASKDRADDHVTTASAVIGGGNLQFAVTWTSQAERGATGYRVYVGTAEGAEDRYFTVADGAINTLTISTLAGATMGPPPEIATGALLRQVPRFESHLFMAPPFNVAAVMNRIAQITCSDWNYGGGKLVMVSPELQEPIVTINRSLLTNFKTYPVDRRENWNQIVGTYRDLDDPFLAPAAKPVEINRFSLQEKYGVITKEINFGCAYRSQVERACNYWARRLIDADQVVEKFIAPRCYRLLPANAIAVTHDVPNWEAVPFYIEEKEENEDSTAGYQMTAQIYGEWYSDTSHEPMPRPLPQTNPSAFVAPPVVQDVTLAVEIVEQATGDAYLVIRGEVQFAAYAGDATRAGEQRGRVWIKKPGGVYERTQIVFPPEHGTLQGSFEWPVVALGDYKFKVVTESRLGVAADFADHPEFPITVTDDLLRGPEPTNFAGHFYTDSGHLLMDWDGVQGKGGSKREMYDLEISVPGNGDFSAVRSVTIDRSTPGVPVIWEFDSQDGDIHSFALVKEGGFDASGLHAGPVTGRIVLRSHFKTAVLGDLLFRFELLSGTAMPNQIGISPFDEVDPLTSQYGLWWGFGGTYIPGDAQPDGESVGPHTPPRTWITADGQEVAPGLGGDQFDILIGRDRIARFFLHYQGPHSVPLLVSPRPIKDPGSYRVYAVTDSKNSSVRNAQIVRPVPDYLYAAQAEKDDNSGALPAIVKARVRQHSFYTNGPPSDWVNATFNRP
jgi:hypothetical protein